MMISAARPALLLCNFSEKPRSQSVKHVVCAIHDALRQRVCPVFICVHLRASAAKFLFYSVAADVRSSEAGRPTQRFPAVFCGMTL
jgi:hypothetical protein